MLSTIVAIIIALVTGTTPAQPKEDPTGPTTETKGKGKTNDPALGTFGGTGQWSENPG